MMGDALSVVCAVAAAVPVICFARNMKLYAPPAADAAGPEPEVSVLIPARNEQANIEGALKAVLASGGVKLEVIVLDDASTDDTARIVREIAAGDSRVRLEAAPALPEGWSGKQHACHVLSTLARHELLVFIDADVRVTPDALARMAGFMAKRDIGLASGVPRQITGSLSEKLLIPFIQFLILGYLPLENMRGSTSPAFGAGCGQLFVAKAGPYRASGGHEAIKATLHDGLMLPRSFRKAGYRTDLFDATPIAACRMYRSDAEVWPGLAKNAHEGLGSPKTILPATVLLLGGQAMPWVLISSGVDLSVLGLALAWAAALSGPALRLVACAKFSQSLVGALLHPLGVTLLVAIQWYALGRWLSGRPASWKGRSYNPAQ